MKNRQRKRRKPITKLKSQRAIFNRAKNPIYWKRPTRTVYVRTRKGAERIKHALAYYAGGAEMRRCDDRKGKRYAVHSKGYYHYIGA